MQKRVSKYSIEARAELVTSIHAGIPTVIN